MMTLLRYITCRRRWVITLVIHGLLICSAVDASDRPFNDQLHTLGAPLHLTSLVKDSVVISPDMGHVGFVTAHTDNRYQYQAFMDNMGFGGSGSKPRISFHPDSSKLIGLVRTDNKWRLFMNIQRTQGYDPVHAPIMSPDASRIVYTARYENVQFVVDNDTKHPRVDMVCYDRLGFTADASILVYPVWDKHRWYMMVNGERFGPWNAIPCGPVFAPQGSRWSFIGMFDGNWYVVDEGIPGLPMRRIDTQLVYGDCGRRLIYWGQSLTTGQWNLIVDGAVEPGYHADKPGRIVVSQDGRIIAAVLQRGNQWQVVRNRQADPGYDAIGRGSLVISPDGRRYAYAAMQNHQWRVVVDGTPLAQTHRQLLSGSLHFSQDGERFAYGAFDNGQWYMIVDGRPQQGFAAIDTTSIQFSNYSNRLGYVGRNTDSVAVVINGKAFGPFADAGHFQFTPDGNHEIWIAMTTDDDVRHLYVNGHPSDSHFQEPADGARWHFTSDSTFQTVVINRPGPHFFRLEAEILPTTHQNTLATGK